MLIVMKPQATPDEVEAVNERIRSMGLTPHSIPGAQRVAIGITGNKGALEPDVFVSMAGVADAIRVSQPFKLVSREVKEEDSIIDVGGIPVGGPEVMVMAGPCSVESKEQILEAAQGVRASGARLLRGGAFKPRTSPYEFQGLKEEGLKLLAMARDATGLKVVTEVKDTETLPMVAEYSDVLQVGARNMQNYSLLAEVGRTGLPVLLKRGLSATLEELLMAAEYVLKEGNDKVMLCERGIRTFETSYRFTLDLLAVPALRELSHLPIVIDPSHAAGRRDWVGPMSLAAAAAGADGIIVEVHNEPEEAICDGPQALPTEGFAEYAEQVRRVAEVAGKQLTAV